MEKSETSLAIRYHQETKYSEQSIQNLPSSDPAAQPVPFKEYHSERSIDLISFLPADIFPSHDRSGPPIERDLRPIARLSRLLYLTYGATARMVWPGGQQIFRAAPSAGGLYPVEVYVITEGFPDVPDGLHNYSVRHHQLVPVFDAKLGDDLSLACFGCGAFSRARATVVLTGIYARSTWRYHERAYRRILLDAGHVLGNLALCAPEEGWRAFSVAAFQDETINQLLFLNAEEESVQLIVPLLEQEEVDPLDSLSPFYRSQKFLRSPAQSTLLRTYHRASNLGAADPLVLRRRDSLTPDRSAHVLEPKMDSLGRDLPYVVVKRRSTREFTGGPLAGETLSRILSYSYRPLVRQLAKTAEVPVLQVPELLDTHLIVLNVAGLLSGVYRYRPRQNAVELVRRANLRAHTHRLCLTQELGRDAAVVVVHSADLTRAIDGYGERVYRSLHYDAGVIGQALNLAAIHTGVGVSGIGGFFDDEVNALLGLGEQHAILYLTVLGEPTTD